MSAVALIQLGLHLLFIPREIQPLQKTNSLFHLVFVNVSRNVAVVDIVLVYCSHSRYPATKSAGSGRYMGYL